MKRRTIKPEFFSDTKTGRLSTTSQVLFMGMWCLSDRQGYLENDTEFLKSQILPYFKGNITSNLEEIIAKGLVTVCSFEERNLLNINNFNKHQPIHPHEAQSSYPPIDSDDVIKCNDKVLHPNYNYKDNYKGKDNNKGKSKDNNLFLQFYELYPKKIAKGKAEQSWNKLTSEEQEKCLEIVKSNSFIDYMISQKNEFGDFRKNPATWLNQKCWEDELNDNSGYIMSAVNEKEILF